MNEAEKERLIKKDLVSVENRIRHAFNQGYEMGLKESRSEKPNTCEDAISRQAVDDAIYDYSRSCDVNYQQIMEFIEKIPSVTPQQRAGRWIVEVWNNREHHTCSECNHVVDYEPCYHYCPYCGAEMQEVKK